MPLARLWTFSVEACPGSEGRISDPHGVVLPRVATRTMTALTAPGSVGHPAAFSGHPGEFQELSLGNPTYLFTRSPPLSTYASCFRGHLHLAPVATGCASQATTFSAVSPRNRTPPRANPVPAIASARKSGSRPRPQVLPRPPRGVASYLTLDRAARWERPPWSTPESPRILASIVSRFLQSGGQHHH